MFGLGIILMMLEVILIFDVVILFKFDDGDVRLVIKVGRVLDILMFFCDWILNLLWDLGVVLILVIFVWKKGLRLRYLFKIEYY